MLSKVAEKLVFMPFYRYLEANGMSSSNQSAYRKQMGTCDVLLDLTCCIQDNLDKSFEARFVQIYFSAAFGLVNQEVLILKLQSLGISLRTTM